MNYPAARCEVSEDRNGMIMPPHPTLSRGGEREQCHPAACCGESSGLKIRVYIKHDLLYNMAAPYSSKKDPIRTG